MTKEKLTYFQGIISIVGSFICTKKSMFYPILVILIVLMVLDQISGVLASKKEALKCPEKKCYGLSSLKFREGIYKKIGYILAIFVAIITDYTIFYVGKELGVPISTNVMFGKLISVWFILNELLSIIENIARMGVKLPKALKNCLLVMKENIEQENKGDE